MRRLGEAAEHKRDDLTGYTLLHYIMSFLRFHRIMFDGVMLFDFVQS